MTKTGKWQGPNSKSIKHPNPTLLQKTQPNKILGKYFKMNEVSWK